eukprot:2582500-Pyramimonas_sp.AAC.1
MSLCSGLCSEARVLDILSIDYTLVATCDLKDPIAVLESRKPPNRRPLHHFSDMFDMLRGKYDSCMFHGCTCAGPPPDELDILVAGFPCQPYSRSSGKRKLNSGIETSEKYPQTKG